MVYSYRLLKHSSPMSLEQIGEALMASLRRSVLLGIPEYRGTFCTLFGCDAVSSDSRCEPVFWPASAMLEDEAPSGPSLLQVWVQATEKTLKSEGRDPSELGVHAEFDDWHRLRRFTWVDVREFSQTSGLADIGIEMMPFGAGYEVAIETGTDVRSWLVADLLGVCQLLGSDQ